MTIAERQEEIISEFQMFENWLDKYAHIIDLAKELPLIDKEDRIEDNKIKGCQSQVWLTADIKDARVRFKADSDAIITKGLVALMIRVLDNAKASEIADADLYFVDEIGLKEHLSPTRSNGLLAMIKQMKIYALAFQAMQ